MPRHTDPTIGLPPRPPYTGRGGCIHETELYGMDSRSMIHDYYEPQLLEDFDDRMAPPYDALLVRGHYPNNVNDYSSSRRNMNLDWRGDVPWGSAPQLRRLPHEHMRFPRQREYGVPGHVGPAYRTSFNDRVY